MKITLRTLCKCEQVVDLGDKKQPLPEYYCIPLSRPMPVGSYDKIKGSESVLPVTRRFYFYESSGGGPDKNLPVYLERWI